MNGQGQHTERNLDEAGSEPCPPVNPNPNDRMEDVTDLSALVNELSTSKELEERRKRLKGVLTIHFQHQSVSLHSTAAVALRALAAIQATSKAWSLIGDPTSTLPDRKWTLVRVGSIEGITWSAHQDGSDYAN